MKEKEKWSLLPWSSIAACVRVMTFGEGKHGTHTWVARSRQDLFDKTLRHLNRHWTGGQERDEETGESHLAHAVCNLLMMMWIEEHTPDTGPDTEQEKGFFRPKTEENDDWIADVMQGKGRDI
jgi:hypothetical protein